MSPVQRSLKKSCSANTPDLCPTTPGSIDLHGNKRATRVDDDDDDDDDNDAAADEDDSALLFSD